MKKYDPKSPLIVSHIPKTAGTSVRELFSGWYGPNLLLHYKDGKRPPVRDLTNLPEPEKPVALYGHFTRNRGFGIEKYYPQIDQFIAIFREPLDRAVSGYFFKTQNEAMRKAFWGTAQLTLDQYVTRRSSRFTRGGPETVLNFLPRAINENNFKDFIESHFVEVGITERLDTSMVRIAEKLGFEFDVSQLQHLNAVKRTHEVSSKTIAKFREHNELEYRIYDYVRSKYDD
ncbi:sulfotransferase family 2 domain-containing protein [Hyphococcus lacteus]|uniref:Sulfotransferase family 2 domain-containing protein n=1 Tax=Hyphococcus lacteus TaxID=3143536 RepID=A0ABV3Z7K3_9PROT